MNIRISLFLLFLFLSFLQAGCYAQDKQNETSEQEAVDPYSWDFGEVKEGEILKHNFVLTNEYKEVLNIKDINTSCGCTASRVEKSALSPGESTLIEVQFKTNGYFGPVQQYIYVRTDNINTSVSPLDTATLLSVDGKQVKPRVEGPLGVNAENSQTIGNQVIKFIIKANVIRNN